jgi:predicted nucleic acid-binding protein
MSEEVKVIGIDTNILVRIITRDDEKQSQIALDYVSNSSTPFVMNHIVICELGWVLESAYKYDKTKRSAEYFAGCVTVLHLYWCCDFNTRKALSKIQFFIDG